MQTNMWKFVEGCEPPPPKKVKTKEDHLESAKSYGKKRQLDPETAPSYSEEALPSASPEEALHDEIIGCTDDDADEERDSGVDDADDSEFEEEFVDRLIQKYL